MNIILARHLCARSVLMVAITFTAALTIGAPAPLRAQTDPDLVLARPADPECATRLAAALALTSAAPFDSISSRLKRLNACSPELGRAIASVMRTSQATTDSDRAAVALSSAPVLVDSAIFAAARDIAVNSAASEIMRVHSLRTLYHYFERSIVPRYEDMVSSPPGSLSCQRPAGSEWAKAVTFGEYTPLPSDFASASRLAAFSIQQDLAASASLRSAAYCVLEAWRVFRGLPGQPNTLLNASGFSVDFICGQRFRFRNTHSLGATIEWNVAPLSRRRLELPPLTQGQAFSERILDVGLAGDVRVFLDGDLILTRPNPGTSCP
jgi:hypothetical protein